MVEGIVVRGRKMVRGIPHRNPRTLGEGDNQSGKEGKRVSYQSWPIFLELAIRCRCTGPVFFALEGIGDRGKGGDWLRATGTGERP